MPALTTIDALSGHIGQPVTLQGWLYNARASKGLHFLVLRDGTGLVQVVVNQAEVDEASWNAAEALTQESAFRVTGLVVESERQIGGVELQATEVEVVSIADEYPITPKEHGVEFLFNHRHLHLRSRRPWAILRIRNRVVMSIHGFFQERGFLQLDPPILTGNAVEGTSTLFELDFFGDPAYLTQSGQLYGEALAMAFGKIYTFGPTFRAEKSKTRRHLAEFWMIEPEMAFADLAMNMDVAEAFLARIATDVLRDCRMELDVLGRDLGPLEITAAGNFPRLTYTEAVDLLKSDTTRAMVDAREAAARDEQAALQAERQGNEAAYGGAKKHEKRRMDARGIEINARLEEVEEELRNLPAWRASAERFVWGDDLGGSDETLLTWHFDRPIIVHRYPAVVKAFYMKRDPEDDRLALGMDVLAPEGYGEIIGGGERATDLDFLKRQVAEHGLPEEVFGWYFDLRRFGSVPHSGFGLGPRAHGGVDVRRAPPPRSHPLPPHDGPPAPVTCFSAPPMRAAFALIALLPFAVGVQAQPVHLQLYDHIVGSDLAHNAPLPAGTEVFVVSKAETRAVRLRAGYSEVVQGLPSARRDRVGREGETDGTYVPTARARRSYYVAARLPDGRLFQSYVKTADAGWQPGFDAVSNGRVSMGRVTGVMEATLRAALPAREAARPAAPPARTTGAPEAAPNAAPTASPDSARLFARTDTLAADSLAADTTVTDTTALDSLGALTAIPPDAVRLDEPEDAPARSAWPWLWALGGLALGAALAAAVLVPRYERRIREQREHLMRLVPTADARPARHPDAVALSEAEQARLDRAVANVEHLQTLVRTRDAEIQKLRTALNERAG